MSASTTATHAIAALVGPGQQVVNLPLLRHRLLPGCTLSAARMRHVCTPGALAAGAPVGAAGSSSRSFRPGSDTEASLRGGDEFAIANDAIALCIEVLLLNALKLEATGVIKGEA